MLRQLMLVCAVGFLAIAVADYAFERHQHYKQLRMSKDEVKREYKEMEGSPEIKSKRRQFHQELQSSNLRADVRRSSVIVANPTHVAIGIRYRRGETPLPLITLKHTDALACGSGASPRKKESRCCNEFRWHGRCCATAMSTSTYRRT